MSAQSKLNISSIIGIKEGIYQVFSLIEQNIDAIASHPDKINPLKDCKNYIHQMDGLFEMLGLSSIAIVSEKMEQVVDALLIKKISPSAQICDALKQSNKALLFYLNELIDGKEENPLRLFPAYRALMQVYGYENAPESDLFFPRLIATPVLKPEVAHINATAQRLIAKQVGMEFQVGLLKWLRDPTQQNSLQQMANAIGKLEEFPGTTEQRAFWWVTAGFLEDLLQQQDTSIDVSVRRLCGKIEQAVRHLAAGTTENTATLLMRELLYHISNSESTSPRLTEIRDSYTWPGQVVDDSPTFEQVDTLQPVLQKLRNTLMQANDMWREFCAGQQESLDSLFEYVEWLGHQALQTECAPLTQIVRVIGDSIANLQAHPQDLNEELAMEMATALLMVESILDDFNKLSPDLPQQISALAERLHHITTTRQEDTELPSVPAMAPLESKTQENELLGQVTQEILVNLAQIENILDKFFFEPAQRAELSGLADLFQQVSGALIMLDLQQANTLLTHCHHLVEKLLQPEHNILEAEQILLVDGLSSLGFFTEAYKSGRPDSHQIIDEAIRLFNAVSTTVSPPVAIRPPQPVKEAPLAPVDTTSDPELLGIFLDEAETVLAGIVTDLQSYQQSASSEALTNLRRAFHTLKGSGRMVQLNAMSEVAWKLEQVLTQWIAGKKPVTEKFIALIDRACKAYGGWCQSLRDHGHAEVIADDLVRSADNLLHGREDVEISAPIASTLATKATLVAAVVETPPVVETIVEKTIQPQLPDAPVDSFNDELLLAFLEETHDIIPQIGSKLRAWRVLPQDEDIHHALLRLLHTLKGSARMAGAMHLGELIHAMESHIATAFHEHNISDAALDQLESEFDRIGAQIEQLQVKQPAQESTPEPAAGETPATDSVAIERTDSLQAKTILRINTELIDRLVTDASEAGILRVKIETQLNQFKQSLQDLSESTHRLHDQLREVEIQAETQMQSRLAQRQDNEHSLDPLEFDRFTRLQELTRLMAESVDDIITVQKSLRASHIAAEEAAAQQSVVNRQLQQSLLQVRTLPFSNFAERYYRIARQVADDLGKKASLEIQGSEVEIDRNILEKINPPLEHLLRNAIAHGIEEPAQRRQAGKPESGQVTLQLHQEANEVIVTLSDDGQGLNLSRIHEEAVRLGLIQPDEALDDDQLMSLIFSPGLSTTDSITGIAGRGIGLDIVRNEISILGGRISVSSTPNQGTTFTIYLPLMLSVVQTFMIRAGKQTYAIPAFIVEHQHEFDNATLQKINQERHVEWNGKKYPLAHLSHLLDEPSDAQLPRHGRVLFLHSGTQHLAIQIDEFIEDTDAVVKNTSSQLAHAPGIEGATITANGDVILIINPVKLLQRSELQHYFNTTTTDLPVNTHKKIPRTPTAMVVDDSLTVRKVTCRLLEREGCEVLMAKNGSEALQILQENKPDVMLVDLEMPKMNGFELIKQVRANTATASIPIIIISSRSAEKHQKIAKSLGVDVFLGKPYREEELLKHLSAFVKQESVSQLQLN